MASASLRPRDYANAATERQSNAGVAGTSGAKPTSRVVITELDDLARPRQESHQTTDIRHLVSTVLESSGNRTITATNGAEAVAVYRSYANQIDLVITDIYTPVMDGVQEILRSRSATPSGRHTLSGPKPPADRYLIRHSRSPLFTAIEE